MTTTGAATGLSLVGHALFDDEGAELGRVVGVYLDNNSRQPEWAAVRGVGGGITVVPLAGATIYEDSLDVPFTREQFEGAPYRRARLARELSEDEEAELSRHYDQGRGQASGATTASTEMASTAKQQGRRVAGAGAAAEQDQRVASGAGEQVGQVATGAKDQGRQVLQSGATQATEAVGAAKESASQVALGARGVLEETRSRLEAQAASGAQRAAENLGRLGDECVALAEGRPQDAPGVADYVRQAADKLLEAADRVYAVADDVESRGLGGLLEDLQGLTRRRPGLFVLGTTAAGFVAGRVIRSAQDEETSQGDHGGSALNPAALDALSRRVWPGDAGPPSGRMPPARRSRSPRVGETPS